MVSASWKMLNGIQFHKNVVFTKKENLLELMVEVGGIKESVWLLVVGTALNFKFAVLVKRKMCVLTVNVMKKTQR